MSTLGKIVALQLCAVKLERDAANMDPDDSGDSSTVQVFNTPHVSVQIKRMI